MRSKRNIRLALSISMIIALALIIPGLSIAGSLEPPSYAVDGSGNPIPTMQPKTTCRGEFYINNDGTVTDCKTGLIWTRGAHCYLPATWSQAMVNCSTLANGICDLQDGSSAGDWHLPTLEELKTLPDRKYTNPALSNAKGDGQLVNGDAFGYVQLSYYWSSSQQNAGRSWWVHMGSGLVNNSFVSELFDVWCVRGGQ
jgi:hypothetical protein